MTAVVTKKALAHSGIKLTEIFKNGNASKVWKSAINVLSAPVNAIQNKLGCAKLSASSPVAGGSGFKATLSAIGIGLITDLVSRIGSKLVDFFCNKADDILKPKSDKTPETKPQDTNIDEVV